MPARLSDVPRGSLVTRSAPLELLSGFLASRPTGEHADVDARADIERASGRTVDARVHRSAQAAAITAALGARALAVGRDVLVGPDLVGSAMPHVIRHELAHVAQAGSRPVDPDRALSVGTVAAEANAERAVAAAVHGGSWTPVSIETQQVHGMIDGLTSADRREWQNEVRERERKRHAEWTSLHVAGHAAELGKQGKALEEDIASTENLAISARIKLFRTLSTTLINLKKWHFAFKDVDVPEDLVDKWGAALLQVDVMRLSMSSGDIDIDVADDSRGIFTAYYKSLAVFAKVVEAMRQSWYESALRDYEAKQSRWKYVQGAADVATFAGIFAGTGLAGHLLARASIGDAPRPPPAPRSPEVAKFAARSEAADGIEAWNKVLGDFEESTKILDADMLAITPEKSQERQALDYALALLDRQRDLQQRHPEAVKIPAVFYPRDDVIDVALDEGGASKDAATTKRAAKAIPWMFYLYNTGFKGYDRPAESGGEWVLEDLTSPKHIKVNKEVSSDFDAAMLQQGARVNPPDELYRELNSALRFPKGYLYLTQPRGGTFELETTEPHSLSWWLTRIGIGLAALGLVLATGGLGTPAAIALIGASVVSVGATLADWKEKEEQGMLTQADINRGIFTIVVDIASALTLGLGTIAKSAAAAARATELALAAGEISDVAAASARITQLTKISGLASRIWVPMQAATVGLDVTNFYIMTSDFIAQFRAIQNDPNLTPEQRRSGLTKLVLMGLLTGGLMTYGAVSGVKDLRKGTPLHGPELEPTRPPSVLEAPPAGITSEVASETAQAEGKWRAPAPRRIQAPELGEGEVVIRPTRDDAGVITDLEVLVHPNARPVDVKIHLEVAEMLRKYGGVQGRIRAFFRRAGGLANIEGAPLSLQMEVLKLRRTVVAREEALVKARRLGSHEVKDLEDELSRINKQLAEAEATLADPVKRAAYKDKDIALKGRPSEEFPPPPEGHVYYQTYRDGRPHWELRRKAGYTGPRFKVEYEGGKPTGRATNVEEVERSGVVGQPMTDETRQKLRDLGYEIDKNDVISRPDNFAKKGLAMKPLTVRGGVVAHAEAETFAEQQARLKAALSQEQRDIVKNLNTTPTERVVLVDAVADTGVTYKEILTPARAAELRRGLIEHGVSPAEAKQLVDDLLTNPKTIKVVYGTDPLRSVDYRTLLAQSEAVKSGAKAAPVAKEPVHHFDPLYMGGGHESLAALNADAHDFVHRFFEKLRMPHTAKVAAGSVLEPNALQRAASAAKRPAAAIIDTTTGTIRYQIL